MSPMKIRTYSELKRLETFEERYSYLRLSGYVGESTFGFDRYINQRFYTSTQWKQVRHQVITRDMGCDLGVEGYDISHKLLVHHMNPMIPKDIQNQEEWILDPEYLITTCHDTHNAIHYGPSNLPKFKLVERVPNDTVLWVPLSRR